MHILIRIGRKEEFYKKDVLKDFEKLTGKHLCWSIFFDDVAGSGPAKLLKSDFSTATFL